jgi:hypothetical protein
VIITVSGAYTYHQLAANAAWVGAVPPKGRSQVFGQANRKQADTGPADRARLAAVTSQATSPPVAIAVSGGLGAALAAAPATRVRPQPEPAEMRIRR